MKSLPTGTVTFLFTDLENSSKLWEAHPKEMQPALAQHDEMLKTAVKAHGGYLVKSTGDGILAAFGSPSDAVTAAISMQQSFGAEVWEATGSLRVRIGLHTGEAQLRADDYFGPTLNRAARVMGIGHGGQVLLSQTTHGLVQDALDEDIGLQDMGNHTLKGLNRPEKIYQLVIPGLPAEFPTLKSFESFPNNLPTQPTPFVGREEEIDA